MSNFFALAPAPMDAQAALRDCSRCTHTPPYGPQQAAGFRIMQQTSVDHLEWLDWRYESQTMKEIYVVGSWKRSNHLRN